MANDTGRLPDSGVTVMPVLATDDSDATRAQPVDATDAGGGVAGTDAPVVDDVVQKRLNDTETALKERQAEFHKLNQQLAEMRGELKATQALTVERAQPAEPETDWLDNEEIDSIVAIDTAKGVKQVARGIRGEFGKLLEMRDSHYEDKIKALEAKITSLSAAADPRRADYRAELDALGGKYAWFKELTPEHQIDIAESVRAQNGKVRPPSTPGGGSIPSQTQTDDDARQAEALAIARSIFPTLRNAETKPGVITVRTTRRGE